MELFAWPPGFDLSSFDPFCLSIEAYLGLCEVHWVLNSVANPLISPSGELPVLKLKGEPIAGTSPIIKVLKQKVISIYKGHDLDHLLSTNEMFESLAFQSMIEDTLHDALLYSWYIENVNYSNVASAVLTNTSSFLSRYTLPQKLKNRVRNRLSNTQKVRDHTGKLVPEVYVMARDCYQVLADKLGEKDFFYGTRYLELIKTFND